MKFQFVWVGKTRNRHWKALQEDYLQRLSHFVKYSIAEVRDKAAHEKIEIEGERLLSKIDASSFVCVLEPGGKRMGSRALARQIGKWQVQGLKEISFVIGGAEGLAPAVVERANFSLSLSFLTFTHETARVILLEQLYRSFTILKGFPYQK